MSELISVVFICEIENTLYVGTVALTWYLVLSSFRGTLLPANPSSRIIIFIKYEV